MTKDQKKTEQDLQEAWDKLATPSGKPLCAPSAPTLPKSDQEPSAPNKPYPGRPYPW